MSQPNAISADLIVHAKWLATGTDIDSVLEHHAIVVTKGEIVDILPSEQAQSDYTSRDTVRLDDHLLHPGLVNAHGHAAMSLLRGIADDLPLQTWLQEHIWPLEGKWVSSEFVYDGTQLAIAEMLLSGTTCFADMYFFPDAAAKAVNETGIRAQLASPVLDFPTAWAQDAQEYIQKATALHDDYKHHPLISVAFGPHAPYTVSDEPLKKIAMLAEEMDVPIHMHVHETAQEVSDAVANTGKRPSERLYELGLLTPRLLCVHATQLNDQDIALLSESGASIVHCPESNLKLASGFCPTAKLQQANINIALGTDGAASNNDLDMIGEMRSAALLAKAVANDASRVSAYEALQMATRNSAKALGLDPIIGTLEVGKSADMVAVDMNHLNTLPVYDPLSQLVYSAKSSQVSHVWVAGKALVEDGELTRIDLDALKAKINTWQSRLSAGSSAKDSK
ncbi:MAG: TRZ/ATZ family hydrolase [Pseudohongiellaceae bacterium]|nr:TRZ/ATZ family hydrolase [Pseudohongiellaceae bacterium]